MLTLLHAADFHLDSPFRALPPEEARQRRADQRQALEALAELAVRQQVSLALLPGDLFDSQQVYPETLEALAAALGRFPCPVVIAPGNHDYYSDASPYAKDIWPENVHIFKEEAVTSFAFPDLGATVYGCAFTSPFREDDPLSGFSAPAEGGLVIGCFHGEVSKAGRYAPIAPESLEKSGLAYAALGHVHAGTGLLSAGSTAYAYSGCPQGRGFDETGDKGCCIIDLDRTVSLRFCPIPGPRYWTLSLPAGTDPAAALAGALASGYENDYVRLTLTGEAQPLDLSTLQALGQGLCRVFDLRDETTAPLELWSRAAEDTLTGHFLREMKARLDAAPEEARLGLQMALRCGLAALEGRETPW